LEYGFYHRRCGNRPAAGIAIAHKFAQILDRSDHQILYSHLSQATPAGTLEAIVVGCIGK